MGHVRSPKIVSFIQVLYRVFFLSGFPIFVTKMKNDEQPIRDSVP